MSSSPNARHAHKLAQLIEENLTLPKNLVDAPEREIQPWLCDRVEALLRRQKAFRSPDAYSVEQAPIRFSSAFRTTFHPDIGVFHNRNPFIAIELKRGERNSTQRSHRISQRIATGIGQAIMYRTAYPFSIVVVCTINEKPWLPFFPKLSDPQGDDTRHLLRNSQVYVSFVRPHSASQKASAE